MNLSPDLLGLIILFYQIKANKFKLRQWPDFNGIQVQKDQGQLQDVPAQLRGPLGLTQEGKVARDVSRARGSHGCK